VVRAGEWEVKDDNGWQRIRHSLKEALFRELGVKLEDKSKYQRGGAWQGELTEEHAEYASNDVIYLKPLAEKLLALLEERGLEETWKLEQRAKPLFLEMCYRGIPFDKERWDALVNELEEKVLALKERADALAPPHPDDETWNWFSPKALQAFELAGLNVPNLQRETLSKYDRPFVNAVSEYRDAKNGLSRTRTWYEGRYRDGRVYPQWNPAGAVTGRASCSAPNIQSLTKEGAYRSCIRP
jgi:DNA polymerase I-like protein with 3'-5' exonuclease and polymerase domains